MALYWLIHEWLLRLAQAQRQLAEDARGGHAWALRIRTRILGFLVARYADRPDDEAGSGAPESERQTYCIVTPEDHPPRRCAELRERLGSIRRINSNKRPRWRWLL